MTIMLLLERQNLEFFWYKLIIYDYHDFHYFYIAFLDCDIQQWTECFCPGPQAWLRHITVLQWFYSSGEFRWVYFSYLCEIYPQEISTKRGKREWQKSVCCSSMELMTRAAWLMSSYHLPCQDSSNHRSFQTMLGSVE